MFKSTVRDLVSVNDRTPLLIDGIKLLKLLPKATETPEHEVRFLVVDLTGRQFDINFSSKYFLEPNTSFRLVIGREWNRKSFCPGSIAIKGLNLPEPFDSALFPRAPTTISWSDRYRSDQGSNAWDTARDHADIVAEGDIRTLCMYWERAMSLLFPGQVWHSPSFKRITGTYG